MAEPEQQTTVVTNIPFLFYDVIGRMFPGGFLILGAVLSSQRFLPLYYFDCILKPGAPSLRVWFMQGWVLG
jgi:hypothetical protein